MDFFFDSINSHDDMDIDFENIDQFLKSKNLSHINYN